MAYDDSRDMNKYLTTSPILKEFAVFRVGGFLDPLRREILDRQSEAINNERYDDLVLGLGNLVLNAYPDGRNLDLRNNYEAENKEDGSIVHLGVVHQGLEILSRTTIVRLSEVYDVTERENMSYLELCASVPESNQDLMQGIVERLGEFGFHLDSTNGRSSGERDISITYFNPNRTLKKRIEGWEAFDQVAKGLDPTYIVNPRFRE